MGENVSPLGSTNRVPLNYQLFDTITTFQDQQMFSAVNVLSLKKRKPIQPPHRRGGRLQYITWFLHALLNIYNDAVKVYSNADVLGIMQNFKESIVCWTLLIERRCAGDVHLTGLKGGEKENHLIVFLWWGLLQSFSHSLYIAVQRFDTLFTLS